MWTTAVAVVQEEGVTNDLLRGPLGEVFDSRQLITGVSGSGNNWAHGHHHYGPRYRDELLEKVRRPQITMLRRRVYRL